MLTNHTRFAIMNHGDCERNITSQSRDAAVAQSVERRIGSAEVTGPIPVSSFFYALKMAHFLENTEDLSHFSLFQ